MSLAHERDKIDVINQQLVALLLQRFAVADKISQLKQAEGLPILNPEREAEVLAEIETLTNGSAYTEYIKQIFVTIMNETKKSEDK